MEVGNRKLSAVIFTDAVAFNALNRRVVERATQEIRDGDLDAFSELIHPEITVKYPHGH